MNRVTYIIPVWIGTQSSDLQATLQSLQAEIHLIDTIIIVYDGHESFGLFCDIDHQILSKVLAVYLYKNSGPGVARNYGVEFSQSQYVFFLDAGDINLPRRTEQQLRLLLEGCEASYGDIEEVYASTRFRIRNSFRKTKLLLFVCHFRAPFNNVTLAIQKAYFSRLGGYYSTRVAEDWVLMAKLLSTHAKIGIVSSPLVRVDVRQSFVFRRRGLGIFFEITKALREISKLNSFNSFLVIVSLFVQFCTRVVLPSYLLSSLYTLLRK